jgi:hypothetical protein
VARITLSFIGKAVDFERLEGKILADFGAGGEEKF